MTIPIIVCTAAKGGVAKSVTTINLAHCLTLGSRPLKPLVIDLDPQGSASRYVSSAKRLEAAGKLAQQTTREGIASMLEQVADFSMPEASSVIGLARGEQVTPQTYHGINIIGYSHGASSLMSTLKDAAAQDRFLDGLYSSIDSSGADLVIIDTPPSNQDAAQFAISTATHMVIPLELTEEGLRGALVADRQRQAMIAMAKRRNVDLAFDLLGVIPSNVYRCALSTSMLKCAQVAFGDLVTSPVDHAVAIGEACAMGLPVIVYEDEGRKTLGQFSFRDRKYTKSGSQFRQVAKEIANRLGFQQPDEPTTAPELETSAH